MTDKSKKLELLAPAGSMDSLVAAAQAGADAVYFGGGAFNARRLAKNFDDIGLERAVEYLRVRGIKAYITFNTLLLDRELAQALDYAAFLYKIGADAVIVQDMGLASILRRELPGLTLHASTQMGIHTRDGAVQALKMGMSRVVLSREVPIKEIPNIAASGAEIEAFAQGAMCMSFSGGCLYSSMAGERSGNRGTCAQPCRKQAAVNAQPGERDLCLSMSDLCMIEHLDELKDAGVCCIKLEGRMKRPEYVAAVTRAYRLALSGMDWREAINAANGIFFRGVRTGYYFGDNAVTGCVAKNSADTAALYTAKAYFDGEQRPVAATLDLTLRAGEKAVLTMSAAGRTVSVFGDAAQPARTPDGGRYAGQLKKLGGTVFFADQVRVDAPDGFLPVSAVNALRREAAEALYAVLASSGQRNTEGVSLPELPRHESTRRMIFARVRNAAQAKAAHLAGADMIALYPEEYLREPIEALQYIRKNKKLLLALPAVIVNTAQRARLTGLLDKGLIDGALAENIGQIEMIKHLPVKIAGPRLNAANAYAVKALYEAGFDRVILSEELTKPQLRDILSKVGGGMRIFGRTELMQLMHCPRKERFGCADCPGGRDEPAAYIEDGAKRRFMLCNVKQAGGCLVRVMNSAITDLTDVYRSVSPEFAELAFCFETPDEVELAVHNAMAEGDSLRTLGASYTRGHWARAVD